MMVNHVIQKFTESVVAYPDHVALVVDATEYTYAELARIASSYAQLLPSKKTGHPLRIAILARRNVEAYASVLAILARGHVYVPLDPRCPTLMLRQMVQGANCEAMVVGPECIDKAKALDVCSCVQLILPGIANEACSMASIAVNQASEHGKHSPCSRHSELNVADTSDEELAYILFTSGSTGRPKAVPVCHRQLSSYLKNISDVIEVHPGDRVSQNFELTFDLSVHDMFVCWLGGGALYCIPDRHIALPAKFIRDNRLTVWFSVPSVIGILSGLGLLRSNGFPTLRVSLFCGEQLTHVAAAMWHNATPDGELYNLYGPTETTIAITSCKFAPSETYPTDCVPIGNALNGQKVRLINEVGSQCDDGEPGELFLSGSQVVSGYFQEPSVSEKAFVQLPGEGNTSWYRTGDRAMQDPSGRLHFLGRCDHQLKVRGHRVELEGIESVLRNGAQTDSVAAIGWPRVDGLVEGVVAFVCQPKASPSEITSYCTSRLPPPAVPRMIVELEQLPLTHNGKTDRRALQCLIQSGLGGQETSS
ncbi:amino acid adenylation domain-containing protein [Novipirellula sp. SH528]|uniref:amino acid adenylation domain-containing protein n=1 Tax=Novipirellula sp. SH528 TaxID=3454466 RepID=UPI003FA1363C